jgi:uncharacterized membrane protein YfcA
VTVAQLLLASGAVALGALVQGAVGFGATLVAAPLLVLVRPDLVPGPISVCFPALSILVLLRDRRHAELGPLRWSVLGLVPGAAVAAVAVAVLPARGIEALVAVLILLAVAASASGLEVEPAPASLTVAGALSGFMGTAAGPSGPAMALLHQRTSGAQLRATLARFFVASSVISIVALLPTGRLGPDDAAHGLLLVPAVLLGYAGSGLLLAHVDRGRTRTAVLLLSAASALAVLVKALS